MNTNGGGYIREVVFEAGRDNPVVPTTAARVAFPRVLRKPVQRHQTHSVCQLCIASHGHTTVAGCYRLVGIERKANYPSLSLFHISTMVPRIRFLLSPRRRKRMCRIFNNPKLVRFRKLA